MISTYGYYSHITLIYHDDIIEIREIRIVKGKQLNPLRHTPVHLNNAISALSKNYKYN